MTPPQDTRSSRADSGSSSASREEPSLYEIVGREIPMFRERKNGTIEETQTQGGIEWDADGRRRRAEAGDVCDDIPAESIGWLLRDGIIAEAKKGAKPSRKRYVDVADNEGLAPPDEQPVIPNAPTPEDA